MFNILLTILLLPHLIMGGVTIDQKSVEKTLAQRQMSLEKRYSNQFVNDVFKDNILLTIDYLAGKKIDPTNVDWKKVNQPFEYRLVLKPGETFAFHDDVLPEYKGKVNKTTNAHFNSVEGFKSSGYLVGDGVCHLASLIYWVAKDAGLKAVAPVNHNFANIPEVPAQYGVSIYATPGASQNDQMQNLYITNNKDKEVAFVFKFDGEKIDLTAEELL